MAVVNVAKHRILPNVAHTPTIPIKPVTHSQRVCRLYKRLYRMKESQMFGFDRAQINRARFCIWRVLLRQRFDENSDIKDMREADRLIKLGEMELKRITVLYNYKFWDSPDGIGWDRYAHEPNDVVLEKWHESERARYPDYFDKRQQRHKEQREWAKLKLKEYDEFFENWKKEHPELYEDYKWLFEHEKRYVDNHYHVEDHH